MATRRNRDFFCLRAIRTCLVGAAAASSLAVAAEPGYVHFKWEEVAKGVWAGITRPDSFQTGNVMIVSLPGQGSLVVDSQNSEYLGREIVEKVKEVGAEPVRYLVNTHLHQDHVGGNAAFRKAYPKVEIIAHRNTCWGIREQTMPRMTSRIAGLTAEVDQMRSKRAALPPGDKEAAALERKIIGQELYLHDAKAFDWALPTTCLNFKPGQARVITAGGRRVEIRYFGGGHSAGDLVVYLPKEKVLAAGDLFSQGGGIIFDSALDGRDGSILSQPRTLKQLRALDFDVAMPGHRELIRGKAAIDAAIANGEKLVSQIKAVWGRGEFVEDALRQIPSPAPQFTVPWHRAVIRGFEEIELRKQLGVPLP